MTLIFAHRGSRATHPENTLAAFQEAIRVKSDGIETDVHLTKDQQLVVIHDETLNRTTDGRGYVQNKTLKELKELCAGKWFDGKIRQEKIPTLDELLMLLLEENYRGMLNIEVKTDLIEYPQIEQLLTQKMLSHPWTFSYLYSSFNFSTLERLHELDEHSPKAVVMSSAKQKAKLAKNTNWVSSFHPSFRWLMKRPDHPLLFDKEVRPWTINKKEDMLYCFKTRVAGFHTDFPEEAYKLRQALKNNGVIE